MGFCYGPTGPRVDATRDPLEKASFGVDASGWGFLSLPRRVCRRCDALCVMVHA